MTSMNDIKGIMATVGTGAAVVTSWMPADWLPWIQSALPLIETALRIGVSLAGLAAGIYAARYWAAKTRQLKTKKESESES